MKASKEQIESAVLFFSKTFDQEQNYKALMEIYTDLPKLVGMIVYEMFLREFNSYHCTDEQYEQYKIIHGYAVELKQRGCVTFENK